MDSGNGKTIFIHGRSTSGKKGQLVFFGTVLKKG